MKKSCLLGAVCALLLVAIVPFANAAFLNGGFEQGSPKPVPGLFLQVGTGGTRIAGWTVTTGIIDWVDNAFWQSSEGLLSIDINGDQAGSISQTFDTVIGQQYQLLFDMAGNPAGTPSTKTLQVSAGNDVAIYTFDTAGKTRQDMGWVEKLFSFTAIDISTTLTLASLTNGSSGAAVDNLRINTVPIPTTLWLFGSGLLWLIGVGGRNSNG